jgi:sulfur carrier protein ThiS
MPVDADMYRSCPIVHIKRQDILEAESFPIPGRFPYFKDLVIHTVRVCLPGGKEVQEGSQAIRIEDLLASLGINPVEVVVVKNGNLVTEGEFAGGEDVIRIHRISHGG